MNDKVKQIRDNDIVPVLENALNYGKPWDSLYLASLEEITDLRRQVVSLGGSLPLANCIRGIDQQQMYYNDPRN